MCEENKATLEEMYTEAIERLKCLKVDEEIVSRFVENGDIIVQGNIVGWNQDQVNRAWKDIEAHFAEYKYLPYAFIANEYILGGVDRMKIVSVLYVAPYKEEWEDERYDMALGCPTAYVYNVTEPLFSEAGGIGVRTENGLLRRDDNNPQRYGEKGGEE